MNKFLAMIFDTNKKTNVMKKRLIFFFIFISFSLFSQKITGVILDAKTKKPINKAHIQIGEKIILSDTKGVFSFIKHNHKEIFISHVNYKTEQVKLTSSKQLEVFLTEDINVLEEVKIVSKELQNTLQFIPLKNIPSSIHSFGAVLNEDKIYVFAGDASLNENSLEKEKNRVFFDGTNEQQAFYRYINMPQFKNVLKFKNDILIYDLKKDSWKFSNQKVRERIHLNATIIKDKIYLIGGKRKGKSWQYLDEKVEIYNFKKDSLIVDDTNPHRAVNFATSVYNSKIIVSGGSTKINENGQKKYSKEIHFFDTETGFWYQLNQFKKGKETRSIVVNDKLYFVGGFRKDKLKEIESYHLKTDTWQTEGNLFVGLERPALTSHNNNIYIFEDEWLLSFNTITKELKEYRINLPLMAPEMFYKDGYLYILGGFKKDDYSVISSRKLVKVSLREFAKTRVRRVLKQEKISN